ncbi:sulfite exporter TauE/SafE family protein [Actinomadura madurae]|uniref:sulfite exporter TauE/SafE family protein n=1 Tax=Actinomadura madurae TaxID=1993 RepID=UPI002026EBE1|nr:sulfite exporter TauE/SafE family protein [Actinomadura madurae]MCP9948993.1 sulfite exporter TauE/SafE family protein [Actinomadura madurae]MCP9965764.1 sulfite exporter TauE/SafE family protein [Actinomadura madurae]MCP9978240.1 sulfite exporter TauE/SafE family protein [Actinomadura madurae]MCQ0010243.1 sulfite exporter TauE/SafE family protein [Actinomadura madurae]MCQ0014444.1 sulfite exporter TauE/SafE family protein [Actinomadura madurae]
MLTLALTLLASLAVGVSLGLLGGGGSILTVPILVYVAGVEAKQAIAMSLFVVGVTSLAGVLPHARAGRVRWRTGLLFGGAGMAGAYAGGRLAAYIPGGVLLAAFAVMMAVTAVAMLRSRPAPAGGHTERPPFRILAEGVTVGLVTGLVGAGGGFLVVPALVLLGGLSMPVAVGTSLLVIAMKSFAGLAGYLSSVQLDWPLTLAVTGAAVLGGFAGSRLAGRIDPDRLRQAFGWFVLVMAVFVVTQEAPAAMRHVLLGTPGGWAALGALMVAAGIVLLKHRTKRCRPPDGGQAERANPPEPVRR